MYRELYTTSARVCFFGDSFVNGVGDHHHLGWVGRLSAAAGSRGIDLTSYNLGIRRDTSGDVAARWADEAAALRLRPEHDSLLVFSFCVNHAVIEQGRTRVDRAQTLLNTSKILDHAIRRAPCIFIGPPPGADQELNDRIAFFSTGIRSHCLTLDVAFYDPFPALFNSSRWMKGVIAGDGVHPDADGYAELAGLIDKSPALRRYLP